MPERGLGTPPPLMADALPLAPGTAAIGTSLASARQDHVHPAQSVPGVTFTPSTPSRVLGTAFQPNATKAVKCTYSVKTQATNPLLAGASSALVTLLSDVNNPPTTERCRVEATSSVALAVAVAITTSNTGILDYICPPGHYVRLVGTTSGTGANTIVTQTEEVIG